MGDMFEARRQSHEPGMKKAFRDLLHKRDMQNVKFCELSKFGGTIIEKQVRERAIVDRVEAIKLSHNMKYKFEEEFTKALKNRKEKAKLELKIKGNFIKNNAKTTANWTDSIKKKAVNRAIAQKEAHLKASEVRKSNQYRKEIKGYLKLNAPELKALQVKVAV